MHFKNKDVLDKLWLLLLWGPAGLFRDTGFATFLDGISGIGFKIAGHGIGYIHDTGNILIFLLGKREKYDMISSYRDK